jgi:hypothetical protein
MFPRLLFVTLILLTPAALSGLLAGCSSNALLAVTAEEAGALDLRNSDNFTVVGAIPLITPGNIPLGLVSRVHISQSSGRFLVSDFASTNAVYRFDPDGRYEHTYNVVMVTGRERERLVDFAVLEDSLYVILPRSLWRLEISSSAVQGSVTFSDHLRHVAVVGKELCVLTDSVQGAVTCFDATLAHRRRLPYPGDPRFQRYSYDQFRPMATPDMRRLVVADVYSPTLFMYDLRASIGSTVRFPGSANAQQFTELWKRDELSERLKRDIRLMVRRFEKVFALPDGRILIRELQRSTKVQEWSLYDPTASQIRRDKNGPQPLSVGKSDFSVLDLIVDSAQGGLVAVIPDETTASLVGNALRSARVTTSCRGDVQCLLILGLAGELATTTSIK